MSTDIMRNPEFFSKYTSILSLCRILLLSAVLPRASLTSTVMKNIFNNALVNCEMFQHLLKFEHQKQ